MLSLEQVQLHYLLTVIFFDAVLLPPEFLTVSIQVYVPLVYTCDTDLLVEVLPSPKSHFLDETVPVLVSVKDTVNGLLPEVLLAVKDATGGFVDTVIVARFEFLPFSLLAVSLTV